MIEEVEELARKMKEKRILLQIPEGLKPKIDEFVDVFRKYGKTVVVDVDPSYGACDIRLNEMKAVGAEAVVHVGHAPMVRLPNVYYIEWKEPANVDAIRKSLDRVGKNKRVCLATKANLRWVLPYLEGENIIVGEGSWRIPLRGVVLGCDTTACDVEADVNVFVGDGYFHPLAIWVNTRRRTYAIRPNGEMEEVNFERLVKKRLALIGSVSGKKVGILVSSKIGQNRMSLAEELMEISREHGYQPTLYVSDYIDPLYVLGLKEDFFVYTGCPRVPIDDYERYQKPLLTPEEFLLKLGIIDEYRIGWITRVPR